MQCDLSNIIEILEVENDKPKESFKLIDHFIKIFGEHNLADRLYLKIPKSVSPKTISMLYSILIWSTSDNGSALTKTTENWLKKCSNERQMEIALGLEVFPFSTLNEMEQVFLKVIKKFPKLENKCNSLIIQRKTQHNEN